MVSPFQFGPPGPFDRLKASSTEVEGKLNEPAVGVRVAFGGLVSAGVLVCVAVGVDEDPTAGVFVRVREGVLETIAVGGNGVGVFLEPPVFVGVRVGVVVGVNVRVTVEEGPTVGVFVLVSVARGVAVGGFEPTVREP